MKKFLAIIFALLTAFAGWFGVSYATKGVAKSWVDTWKGNVKVEQPEEHVHLYVDVVTAPTCTEQGFITHTCDCGDFYVDTYVEALGHTFTNYVDDENVTCTENGTKTAKCNHCDVTDVAIVEALGHSYNWVIDQEETYEENGIKHEECVCGDVKNANTIIDQIYNADHVELDDYLYLSVGTNATYNETACIYTDGNGTSGDEYASIGYLGEISKCFSASMRYQAVYREYDGSFTLNNNGMVLKDKDGNDLSLNGADWISMNYATPGFMIYDEERNLYQVILRMYPNSQTLKYSLDIATMSGRYRLISEEINALCEDFLNCGYIDFDFGVYEDLISDDIGYIYGFRFATANKEITYLSDGNGTIKNDASWFICENNNSISGESTSIVDVLGWIEHTSVFNSPQNSVLYVLKGNTYYASAYSKENTGSLVFVEKGSDWFDNYVKPFVWEEFYKQ